jgi:hypothetical protein
MSFKVSRLISPSSFGGNESSAPTISGGGGSSSSSGPTGVYTNLSCSIITGSSGTFTSFRVGTVTGTTGSFGYIGANYLYAKGDSTKIVDIKNSLDVSVFNVDTSSTSTGVVNIQGNLNCNGIITFVDVERVDDGTVLSPAYSFSGDVDCGLYRIDTRNIGMSIGGVLQAHWTVTGLEGTTGSFNVVTGATGSFNIVTSQTGVFSNTVLSSIVTGTTGVFNGGTFNTLTSQTGVFSNTVSAPTGSFTTNVTSPLHTGTTGNFNGGTFNTLSSQTGVFSNTVLSALVTGTTGNFNGGTFNTLSSQTGVFSNTVSAPTGSFTTNVTSPLHTGTTGNFNGGTFNTLSSQTGVFSNTVSAPTGSFTTNVTSPLHTGTTGNFNGGTFNTLSSQTGVFSNTVSAPTGSFTTNITSPIHTGTTGSFTNVYTNYIEMNSTTQGMLLPRMTTAQRDAISPSVTGLVVMNTDTSLVNFYGSNWKHVGVVTYAGYIYPVAGNATGAYLWSNIEVGFGNCYKANQAVCTASTDVAQWFKIPFTGVYRVSVGSLVSNSGSSNFVMCTCRVYTAINGGGSNVFFQRKSVAPTDTTDNGMYFIIPASIAIAGYYIDINGISWQSATSFTYTALFRSEFVIECIG